MASPDRYPPALHDRAIQDLSFIRRTMEGASSFTDVPGWGLVGIGLSALLTAALAQGQPTAGRWLAVWTGEAVLAASVGTALLWFKMRRNGRASTEVPLSVPARKFFLGLLPAIVAGAILTIAMINATTLAAPVAEGIPPALPALWLTLYGTGIVTAGMHSVRAVPLMGVTFMVLGAIAGIGSPAVGAWTLALGFGFTHIGFGLWIARRHGG
jgi:hypothetical protein